MIEPDGVGARETLGAEERRRFLESCGTFAAVTPPAITLLLTTAGGSYAVSQSGGSRGDPPPDPGGSEGGDVGGDTDKPAKTVTHLKYEPAGGRGMGK